ncbi:hypothetical protein ABT025_33295 [Streptomyces sp. NPDC002809]|uniref:hypothetical protein n=1 Tax=Streptomyces sp. NPDC002809 TaxID=3154433 RepID=UPI003329AEBE
MRTLLRLAMHRIRRRALIHHRLRDSPQGAGITCHHDPEPAFTEPAFTEPAFVCRPADFEDPVFRRVTSEEPPSLSRRFGACPPAATAFEAHVFGMDPVT